MSGEQRIPERRPPGAVRPSTLLLCLVGGLLLAFEAPALLHPEPSDVNTGWAILGAWIAGLILAAALLKYLALDRRR